MSRQDPQAGPGTHGDARTDVPTDQDPWFDQTWRPGELELLR